MSTPPKSYRICRFDGPNNNVTADWLEAGSDDEAIAKTQATCGTKCELWDGTRLVARFEGDCCAA